MKQILPFSLSATLNHSWLGVALLALWSIPSVGLTSAAEAQSLARMAAATINEQAKLVPSDDTAGDFFGAHVSLSGDRALIGASGDTDNGESSGAAYVFVFDGAQWNQQLKLTPSDGPIGDFNRISVSLSAKRVLVGTADSAGDGGAAYVFGRGSQR